uniref:HIG1 domain-containing protein n=1 Tax=Panagrolaimus sp. JU765 TaxID=591449 RepID=A0AC34QFW1_9BILA
MEMFGEKLLGFAGIRRARMDTEAHKEDKRSFEYKQTHLTPEQLKRTKDNRERYSPVPAIPSDIGYRGNHEVGGAKQSGVMQNVAGNPAVIIGLGLTTLAILGMIRKSVLGDKIGTQKYMQYRIMAQFFTVTALVAGVTIFGSVYEKPAEDEKPAVSGH